MVCCTQLLGCHAILCVQDIVCTRRLVVVLSRVQGTRWYAHCHKDSLHDGSRDTLLLRTMQGAVVGDALTAALHAG
jgi:hypothetical protein